ncbi:hypothetical protein QOT17_024062 [Balamuthia mandrillaris]
MRGKDEEENDPQRARVFSSSPPAHPNQRMAEQQQRALPSPDWRGGFSNASSIPLPTPSPLLPHHPSPSSSSNVPPPALTQPLPPPRRASLPTSSTYERFGISSQSTSSSLPPLHSSLSRLLSDPQLSLSSTPSSLHHPHPRHPPLPYQQQEQYLAQQEQEEKIEAVVSPVPPGVYSQGRMPPASSASEALPSGPRPILVTSQPTSMSHSSSSAPVYLSSRPFFPDVPIFPLAPSLLREQQLRSHATRTTAAVPTTSPSASSSLSLFPSSSATTTTTATTRTRSRYRRSLSTTTTTRASRQTRGRGRGRGRGRTRSRARARSESTHRRERQTLAEESDGGGPANQARRRSSRRSVEATTARGGGAAEENAAPTTTSSSSSPQLPEES